jgi:hypothetical protein
MWWCLKTKTVSDFMAIILIIMPVHTEYIPVMLVCTIFCITYQYVLSTYQYIQVAVCTKYPDFVQPVTIPDVHFWPAE